MYAWIYIGSLQRLYHFTSGTCALSLRTKSPRTKLSPDRGLTCTGRELLWLLIMMVAAPTCVSVPLYQAGGVHTLLPCAPEGFLPIFLSWPGTHFLSDVPKEQRLQAVQAAILLLADENREVLQTLLCFLNDVVNLVEENQMTPMNLAVCLAPSLFHLNLLKKESSPRWVPQPQPSSQTRASPKLAKTKQNKTKCFWHWTVREGLLVLCNQNPFPDHIVHGAWIHEVVLERVSGDPESLRSFALFCFVCEWEGGEHTN